MLPLPWHGGPDACEELATWGLLELIVRRRTIGILCDLLAAEPARLIGIDCPPLYRPEAQVLALFARRVVLLVAAGAMPRGAIATAVSEKRT